MTTNAPTRFLLACDTLPTNPWSRDRLPSIREAARGFELDVMDIYEFGSREEAHTIHRETRKHHFQHRDLDLEALNAAFLARVRTHEPHVVILGTVDCYSRFLLPETVQALREQGIYTVGILGDDEFTHHRNILYVPLFDAAVVYVRSFVERYEALGTTVHWLPNSCAFPEPDFDTLQVHDRDKRFDAILMGAPFGVRPALVRALVSSGVNVGLFGSRGWQDIPDLAPHYRGFVPHGEIGDVMRSARVVIAPMEDHLTGALHMNTKLWDAVKHGQFAMATRYSPLLSDYGFVEGQNIALYGSAQELVDQVKRYRDDPVARTRVARGMFETTREHFDYAHLYRKLFEKLDIARRHARIAERETQVTIVDLSGTGAGHAGFERVCLPRRGWQRSLRKSLETAIQTPYVIVTRGGISYSPYLNAVIDRAPHRFRQGRLLLRARRDPWTHIWADSGRVAWKREALLRRLREPLGPWPWSLVRRLPHGHDNLRLCCEVRPGLGPRVLAALAGVAASVRSRWPRKPEAPVAAHGVGVQPVPDTDRPGPPPLRARTSERVYCVHDLLDVAVDQRVSEALLRSIEFQIGHFRDRREGAASLRIQVRPYEPGCLEDLESPSRFHRSSGVAGRGVDMPDPRIAVRCEDWGFTLYLERGSGFLMLAIQLLLSRLDHTLVHAGALADANGDVILLPGAGGVGKTALVGALAQQGRARLLGDDLVLLSAAGRVRCLPRDFVLKDYHRSLAPQVFDPGITSRRRELPREMRRALRHVVRNAPLRGVAESLLARMGALAPLRARLSPTPPLPEPRTVPVASLFGPGAVLSDGPLREVLFLERVDDLTFRYEALDTKALVRRMASILHHEWADHMRSFWQLGALEVVDLPAYFAEMVRILEAGTASVPIHVLQIPENAPPDELVDVFCRHVAL